MGVLKVIFVKDLHYRYIFWLWFPTIVTLGYLIIKLLYFLSKCAQLKKKTKISFVLRSSLFNIKSISPSCSEFSQKYNLRFTIGVSIVFLSLLLLKFDLKNVTKL